MPLEGCKGSGALASKGKHRTAKPTSSILLCAFIFASLDDSGGVANLTRPTALRGLHLVVQLAPVG